MRMIDADALFAVVQGHHDLYKGATNPADKARRDECLQMMCDINDAPTIAAIPLEWLREKRVTHPTTDAEILHNSVIRAVLVMWEREREARE